MGQPNILAEMQSAGQFAELEVLVRAKQLSPRNYVIEALLMVADYEKLNKEAEIDNKVSDQLDPRS